MSVKNIGLKKQIVLIKVYRNKQSKQKSLPLSWFINFYVCVKVSVVVKNEN